MGMQLTKICNKRLTTVTYIRVSDTFAENQRKNKQSGFQLQFKQTKLLH